MIDGVFVELEWQICGVCLGDAVVFCSPALFKYLQWLAMVLEAIRKASLLLKPQKCHLRYNDIQFPEHVISTT